MKWMGFGLVILPKMMNAIIKWAVRLFTETGKYIDDIVMSVDEAQTVADQLQAMDSQLSLQCILVEQVPWA